MRNLTQRHAPGAPPCPPKGLSFEIGDLIFSKAWADFHDFRMSVCLDHGAEGEEYEEVIVIHAGTSCLGRLLLWCNADNVFVQPLIGKRRRYSSVAEALESIQPPERVTVTDIVTAVSPR
jgi:hypothetical protein